MLLKNINQLGSHATLATTFEMIILGLWVCFCVALVQASKQVLKTNCKMKICTIQSRSAMYSYINYFGQ